MKSSSTVLLFVFIIGIMFSCKKIEIKQNVLAYGTFRIFQNRAKGRVELDTGTLFIQIYPAINPAISSITFDVDGINLNKFRFVCALRKDRSVLHCSTDTSLLGDISQEYQFLNYNFYTASIQLNGHIDVEKIKTIGIEIQSRFGKEKVRIPLTVKKQDEMPNVY